jgi:hypothetical protein
LAFVFVKPGRDHRRVGHGLDSVEPLRDDRFLRFALLPFFPELLPIGRSL